MTSSKSACFVIEMETVEDTGKLADFIDVRGTTSPKKSTPKQIKENFEKILNVRSKCCSVDSILYLKIRILL